MTLPTTLTVYDGAATPVAHVFTKDRSEGPVQYYKSSDGTPIGDKTISISLRKVGARTRVRIMLKIPVVQTETINGISTPKVVREEIKSLSYDTWNTSLPQERTDSDAMLQSLLGNAALVGINVGLDSAV